MDKNRLLIEFLDQNKPKLQALQDTFAEALDFAFITVDYRGEPLLEYSGFTDFCKMIRQDEARRKLCYQSDAHGGLHATITGEPYIYKCHAGLVDFAVPIIVDGNYLGAVMGGQLELCERAPEFKNILAQRTKWAADDALVASRRHVHKSDYNRLVAGVNLLQETIQNLVQHEQQRLLKEELKQKNKELISEREARFDMEKKIAGGQAFPVLDSFQDEELFDILNAISCLAFVEQAEGTHQMVCNFSEMLRSLLDHRGTSVVPLEDEIRYAEAFLKIQEKRYEGKLTYQMNIPEQFYSVSCPFMLLQSLVQNVFRYVMEQGISNGTLFLNGEGEEGFFVLLISDRDEETVEETYTRLIDYDYLRGDGPNSFINTNRLLKDLYGVDCGIFVEQAGEGRAGTQVQIKLPMRRTTT